MNRGRLKRVLPFIEEDTFLVTYGDGVANTDITNHPFHKEQKKDRHHHAVQPAGRFGDLELSGSTVTAFKEKSEASGLTTADFLLIRRASAITSTDDTLRARNSSP